MATTKRTAKQVAKDKAALKRLKKSGSYSGKIDLRKAPTKYQLKKLAELKSKSARKPRPTKQKIPGARITQTEVSAKQLAKLKAPKHSLTTYALPFLRKGQQEPEWRRFTYKQLRAFLAEYKPDDPEGAAEWLSYAVAEKWSFDTVAQVAGMRKETNLYFSGVRISHPEGQIKKHVKSQSPAALRKARERAKKGSRGSGGRK